MTPSTTTSATMAEQKVLRIGLLFSAVVRSPLPPGAGVTRAAAVVSGAAGVRASLWMRSLATILPAVSLLARRPGGKVRG